MPIDDTLNAFVPHGLIERRAATEGPLADLSFAVKDLFDVAGAPTGAGSPDWLATHEVPRRTAPSVQRLLDAGARLVGKTLTDEMAWSLMGENAHYGTPVNPRAPGRVPGGSSNGSAAAVAGGVVDFAVGSDTGGSVRLPASFCGIWGLRPTHGRIGMDGAVPLAPSFDTFGWFAQDPALLRRVGAVLLGGDGGPAPARLLIAEDAFALAGPAVAMALRPGLDRLAGLIGPPQSVRLADDLAPWRDAFRVIQSSEAWSTHGEWVRAVKPRFGPGVRERFQAAAELDPAEVRNAEAVREEVRRRMDELLAQRAVLALPSAPGIAPLRGSAGAELEAYRARALAILCPASLAGTPQIAMPLGVLDGCPVGLSLIGARGSDEALLDLAARLGTDRT